MHCRSALRRVAIRNASDAGITARMWGATKHIRPFAGAVSKISPLRVRSVSLPDVCMSSGSSSVAAVNGTVPGWWRWLGISVAVIALDQITKALVVGYFMAGEQKPVTSFFSLVLAFNSGAAFSFLASAEGWQRWLFAGIAAVASAVIAWLLKRGGSAMYCTGLALILGGAVGNLWDRVAIGRVV